MKKMSKILSLAVITVGLSTSFVSAEGYVFSENAYKVGMNHKDVKVIQEALKKDGTFTHGTTTTFFGEITKKAVIGFQKKNGLKADGIVGPGTINKMKQSGLLPTAAPANQVSRSNLANRPEYVFAEKVYKLGMNHQDVRVIQEALKKDGVYTFNKFTTYYGTETEKAVKAFQKKYKISSDGVVGRGTLSKMNELGLFSANTNVANPSPAKSVPANSAPASRGAVSRSTGQYLDWFADIKDQVINLQDILTIQDFETGKTFKVKVTAGSNHADVEALTKEDTDIMKEIWGGFSWDRRPVLVYKGDYVLAGSMTNMPHAGVENRPGGETVSNRSGGYGRGYNFDFVKGNGMEGHVDLHFKGSLRHKDSKQDSQHQSAIKKAAGK